MDALNELRGHVFVCGEAGTGKSVVLRNFVESTDKKVAVCAPTGLAATHVDGVTIHSLFRLPISPHFLDYSPRPEPDTDKVLAAVDAIVIDEASMVRADMLDAIDARLRLATESTEPFGGVQMILFGDLLQLPPVVTPDVRENLQREYESAFFFDSHVARNTSFSTLQLDEIVRQQDPVFVAALRRARTGSLNNQDLQVLNASFKAQSGDLPTPILATTNDVVNKHNKRGLDALPGKSRTYTSEWRATDGADRPKDSPCEPRIELKIGCPVLFTRNDFERGVSNGTTGVVSELDADSVTVECEGKKIVVEQDPWEVKEYAVDAKTGSLKLIEVGEFLQLPLRLGFAMTIHRSQGQTYDAATVDFAERGPFAEGQGYVAISRVKSLAGLTLTRELRRSDFKHSTRAAQFLASTTSSNGG